MNQMTKLLAACSLAYAVGVAAQTDSLRTVVNGVTFSEAQKVEFMRSYGVPPLGGNFWYDTRSGLWGVVGRESFGTLRPGHAWGRLSPEASKGTTGVFINGRQINLAEAMYIRSLLGSVMPGRWWLDGSTGYFGLEGYSAPVGNLFAIARAARARGNGSSAHYYNDGMGTSVASSAGCTTGATGTGSSRTSFIVGCD